MQEGFPQGSRFIEPKRITDPLTIPKPIHALLEANENYRRRYLKEKNIRNKWLASHLLEPIIDGCVDGRNNDLGPAFGEFAGVPLGVITVNRTAGAKGIAGSFGTCRLERDRVHGLTKKDRIALRILLAHYSATNPQTASCAAWNHDTAAAVASVRNSADVLNWCFGGQAIAIHGLMNTDDDSVVIYGPAGELDTRQLADADATTEAIAERLETVFPANRLPASGLYKQYRPIFYREFGELLHFNTLYVKHVLQTKRPLEMIDNHQELAICVGRHFDWIVKYNSVFLISEANRDLEGDFLIALRYTAKNVVIQAVKNNRRDFAVPVLVNVPYNGKAPGNDERITQVFVRNLRERLAAAAAEANKAVVYWLLCGDHGLPSGCKPEWVRQRLLAGIPIDWCASVSNRANRLFIPFI